MISESGREKGSGYILKCFEVSDALLKATKSVNGKLIDLSCITVMLVASSMLDSHLIINAMEVSALTEDDLNSDYVRIGLSLGVCKVFQLLWRRQFHRMYSERSFIL